METANSSTRSHLFTIRVWEEEIKAAETEWRGKVQLVSSGEVRYFREWSTLVALLPQMLSEALVERESDEEKRAKDF